MTTEKTNDSIEAFHDSELIIGLVAAVGTDLEGFTDELVKELQAYGYESRVIKISREVIPLLQISPLAVEHEFARIDSLMTAGDKACEQHGNSILAKGVASIIGNERLAKVKEKNINNANDATEATVMEHGVIPRRAYIVHQLKRPEEVNELRSIYNEGFYLFGIHTDEDKSIRHLVSRKISEEDALKLKKRDENEDLDSGQKTRDTFELSDIFIHDANPDARRNSIQRALEILFGHPFRTPTFDEFAMFSAFTAGLRSADLSRQVGAVVTKNESVLATGANDCPRGGGGLYWPNVGADTSEVYDTADGRDYMRGFDSNATEKSKIVNDIFDSIIAATAEFNFDEKVKGEIRSLIARSRIRDITEYGRMVHAEMEAILSCARNGLSCVGATLYCTTFPCHNCAKHIIAAGIKRVVYVEPYPKSKAPEFHDEAMELAISPAANDSDKVHFQPFVGIGPRRFISLFSMNWGMGYPLDRKNEDGQVIQWKKDVAVLRLQMPPSFYIGREIQATNEFETHSGGTKNDTPEQ